ncbi:MAG: hypothetical protein JW847_06985 [Candidatus Omnitrophica bacterium]|nr:hypothetical protein [Candidatus Omnitrophota bacterium]
MNTALASVGIDELESLKGNRGAFFKFLLNVNNLTQAEFELHIAPLLQQLSEEDQGYIFDQVRIYSDLKDEKVHMVTADLVENLENTKEVPEGVAVRRPAGETPSSPVKIETKELVNTRKIEFGTSGDRGKIEDYTNDSRKIFDLPVIRRITQGAADYILGNVRQRTVIVGYDTRKHNPRNARETASILAANGIKVLLVPEATPTPVLAYWASISDDIAGVINFTASHNPKDDNGFKFSPSHGGAADEGVTNAIGRLANTAAQLKTTDYQEAKDAGMIMELDADQLVGQYTREYIIPTLKKIGAWKDIVDYIKANRDFRLVLDPMQGTSVKYLQAIYLALEDESRPEGGLYEMINMNNKDPEFKEVKGSPKPDDKNSREPLVKKVMETPKSIGIATDGDADRFGTVDFGGVFVSADDLIGLLTYFLVEEVRLEGGAVGKTVATNDFSNAIVNYINAKRSAVGEKEIEMVEVDVGFKWVVEQVVKHGKQFIVAGEESAHVGVGPFMRSWDDGIAIGLMTLWLVAKSGMSLSEYKTKIEKTVGLKFVKTVADIQATSEEKAALKAGAEKVKREIESKGNLAEVTIVKELEALQDQKVANLIPVKGGLKFIFASGDNLLLRPSGTQDVIKYYVGLVGKSDSNIDAARGDALIEVGKQIVNKLASSPVELKLRKDSLANFLHVKSVEIFETETEKIRKMNFDDLFTLKSIYSKGEGTTRHEFSGYGITPIQVREALAGDETGRDWKDVLVQLEDGINPSGIPYRDGIMTGNSYNARMTDAEITKQIAAYEQSGKQRIEVRPKEFINAKVYIQNRTGKQADINHVEEIASGNEVTYGLAFITENGVKKIVVQSGFIQMIKEKGDPYSMLERAFVYILNQGTHEQNRIAEYNYAKSIYPNVNKEIHVDVEKVFDNLVNHSLQKGKNRNEQLASEWARKVKESLWEIGVHMMNGEMQLQRVRWSEKDSEFTGNETDTGDITVGLFASALNPLHFGQFEPVLRAIAQLKISVVGVANHAFDYRKQGIGLNPTFLERDEMAQEWVDLFEGLLVLAKVLDGSEADGETKYRKLIEINGGRKGKTTFVYTAVGGDHMHVYAPSKEVDEQGYKLSIKDGQNLRPGTVKKMEEIQKLLAEHLQANNIEMVLAFNFRELFESLPTPNEVEQLKEKIRTGFISPLGHINLFGTSSTNIRDYYSGQEDKDVTFLPVSVEEYIRTHGRYRGWIIGLPYALNRIATGSEIKAEDIQLFRNWLNEERNQGKEPTARQIAQDFSFSEAELRNNFKFTLGSIEDMEREKGVSFRKDLIEISEAEAKKALDIVTAPSSPVIVQWNDILKSVVMDGVGIEASEKPLEYDLGSLIEIAGRPEIALDQVQKTLDHLSNLRETIDSKRPMTNTWEKKSIIIGEGMERLMDIAAQKALAEESRAKGRAAVVSKFQSSPISDEDMVTLKDDYEIYEKTIDDFLKDTGIGKDKEVSVTDVEDMIKMLSDLRKKIDEIPEEGREQLSVNEDYRYLLSDYEDMIKEGLARLGNIYQELIKAAHAEIQSSPVKDVKPGGIDLNPELLDLQIKRDGNGIPLPLNQQPVYNMKIEGFLPVIINITPVANNLPLLLGMLGGETEDSDMSYRGLDPMNKNRIAAYVREWEAEDIEA